MSPCVCYGFRPSFELRLCGDGVPPHDGLGLGLGLANPYAEQSLRTEPVRRFLRRALEHVGTFPDVVRFYCEHRGISADALPAWNEVASLLEELEQLAPGPLAGLQEALRRDLEAVAMR